MLLGQAKWAAIRGQSGMLPGNEQIIPEILINLINAGKLIGDLGRREVLGTLEEDGWDGVKRNHPRATSHRGGHRHVMGVDKSG